MQSKHEIRTHRVGSLTAGLCMIAFGVLFLLHSFGNLLSLERIFRLWPVILIGLGLELLVSNFLDKKLVYDKAAVFLLILMSFFSMGMACAELCLKHAAEYL